MKHRVGTGKTILFIIRAPLLGLLVMLMLLSGCGVYECDWCGNVIIGDAYYEAGSPSNSTLCADCARKYYSPFPYTSYKKGSDSDQTVIWIIVLGTVAMIIGSAIYSWKKRAFIDFPKTSEVTSGGRDRGIDNRGVQDSELIREPGQDEWKCSKCGRINHYTVRTCGCGEVNPGKKIYRGESIDNGSESEIETNELAQSQSPEHKYVYATCPGSDCSKELYFERESLAEGKNDVECPFCGEKFYLVYYDKDDKKEGLLNEVN